MVDADVLRRRTGQVLHHCARLEQRSDLSAERLATDEDLRNSVMMDLQQAIQACIDLAAHACVDGALGTPATAAEAFVLLSRHGTISESLSLRLVGAAGLRNLIVHQYVDLDIERLLHVIREDLVDLRRFVTALSDC